MSNIPSYTLLDPRVQKTIDLLYVAFYKLVREKHYKYISVGEITKAAKINRGTFYLHFRNKDEFIIYCTREGLRREIITRFDVNTLAANKMNLRLIVDWALGFIQSTYKEWHFQWEEILFEKATRVELYFFLDKWLDIEKNKNNKVEFSNIYAMTLSSAIVGTGLVWCDNDCLQSKEEIVDKITYIFTQGLPANKLE
jgi:hypothetical protein